MTHKKSKPHPHMLANISAGKLAKRKIHFRTQTKKWIAVTIISYQTYKPRANDPYHHLELREASPRGRNNTSVKQKLKTPTRINQIRKSRYNPRDLLFCAPLKKTRTHPIHNKHPINTGLQVCFLNPKQRSQSRQYIHFHN